MSVVWMASNTAIIAVTLYRFKLNALHSKWYNQLSHKNVKINELFGTSLSLNC